MGYEAPKAEEPKAEEPKAEEKKTEEPSKVEEYVMEVKTSKGVRMGLRLSSRENRVQEVMDQSHASAYNETAPEEKKIKVGDIVCEFNGESVVDKIIPKMKDDLQKKDGTPLVLKIKRGAA